MTVGEILALHRIDLNDKIACVTHFYPAFADSPLPAQKAVSDAREKVTGRGIHAPPPPYP